MKIKIKVRAGRMADGSVVWSAQGFGGEPADWPDVEGCLADDLANMDAMIEGPMFTVVAEIPEPPEFDGGEVKGEVIQ